MAGIDGISNSIVVKSAVGTPPSPAARSQPVVLPPTSDAGTATKQLGGPSAAERRAQAAEIQQSANKVQQMLVKAAPNLSFSVDKDSGRTVIKVVDPETHEVLRQIPAEEILRMDKNLDQMIERLKGLLIDKQS